jgi:chitin disaccharide deacetylase
MQAGMTAAKRQEPVRYVLTADDYAITAGVSRAILTLLEHGRISATGVMTNRPHWAAYAGPLAAFADTTDLGLHLNLTCGAPLTSMPRLAPGGELPPLKSVLAAAATGRAAMRAELTAEIRAQIAAFTARMGRAPDFIDGHQHAHALPFVRAALFAAVKAEGVTSAYLRDPADTASAIRARGVAVAKAITVAALARGFGAACRSRGLAANVGFSGFSPFDPARDFTADMARFLVRPGSRHLVMCHPGHADDELRRLDPVVDTRDLEFAALMAGAGESGGHPVRFRNLFATGAGS